MRRPTPVMIVLLAAAPLLAACQRGALVEGEAACRELRGQPVLQHVPVVLIVNDATRRDRLGVYGGRARTPAFDAFARENLLFRDAFAQAPWTRPSVASLFTGLLPSQHGVGMEAGTEAGTARQLPDEVTTLAEVLRAAGYRTAAFVSNPWLVQRFDFQQGFDLYDDSFARWGYPGVQISEAALRWLDDLPPGQPFFLYLHYLDSHRPYPPLRFEDIEANRARVAADPHPPLSERAQAELRALVRVEGTNPLTAALVEPTVTLVKMEYEKGIEHFDDALGRFLTGFSKNGAYERAAILVTSDHGEALYTRGYGNHGQGLYDDELAIPFAARLPGISGPPGGVDCQVGLIDVLPTLCAYLGIECPAQLAGRSLLAAPGAKDAPRFLVAEAVGGQPTHRAVRGRRYKLLFEPGHPPSGPRADPYLLYDLAADPGETKDLLAGGDPHAREVAEGLKAILHAPPPPGPRITEKLVPLDPAVEERLRQLGYVK